MAYVYSKGPTEVGAAELSGYLDGVSYLNRDRKSFFAESFLMSNVNEETLIQNISAIFQENPVPKLMFLEEKKITVGELEQDLSSSILRNSYITENGKEGELGAYISFKIMDRIDDFLEFMNVKSVNRIRGRFGNEGSIATFYCLTTSSHTLVIYLHARAEKESR